MEAEHSYIVASDGSIIWDPTYDDYIRVWEGTKEIAWEGPDS